MHSQYEYFQENFNDLVIQIENIKNPLILSKFIKILNTIVYQNIFSLKINYRVEHYKIISHAIPLIIDDCINALEAIIPS